MMMESSQPVNSPRLGCRVLRTVERVCYAHALRVGGFGSLDVWLAGPEHLSSPLRPSIPTPRFEIGATRITARGSGRGRSRHP